MRIFGGFVDFWAIYIFARGVSGILVETGRFFPLEQWRFTGLILLVQPAMPAKLALTTIKQQLPHRPPAKFVYPVRIKIPREVQHVYFVHQVQR